METAKREMTFWLADPERRLLVATAKRLPKSIMPDHLSGIGVFGAALTGVGYAMSGSGTGWLWIASVGLFLNWFGDSLDGTLARVRKMERPRYGYYLDHMIDALSTAMVGIGIGLSPYVNLPAALVLVVVYLMLSINVYLESNTIGVFKMAYGRVGPTEGRIVLVLGNTALVLLGGLVNVAVVNAIVISVVTGMFVMLSVRVGKNLHYLASLEPAKPKAQVEKVAVGGGEAVSVSPASPQFASAPVRSQRQVVLTPRP
ncbi:MAG: CDP-alcohol phosphatidyltransferase family protein [Gemmatimonadota bacterium]|nr:CDP-alcohol phosphatidyltransferase family protein [Gemmatimonadota bacterium]